MTANLLPEVFHALGRPREPQQAINPYRDHYCLPVKDPRRKAFKASNLFRHSLTFNDGRDDVWKVTEEGREAMATALREGWKPQ